MSAHLSFVCICINKYKWHLLKQGFTQFNFASSRTSPIEITTTTFRYEHGYSPDFWISDKIDCDT